MPDHNNRQVKNNVVSNQSADNIEDAIWRLKIHDHQEQGGMAQSSPYPDRPGVQDCVYYLRTGLCGYGNNCRYNHPTYAAQGTQFREELPERVGQPDCGYYLKTGTCKYGSTCKYHHPRDRNGAGPVSFNILGLPMRQDEKSCPYYMRTGSCKFGVACKFHHPQPSSTGTAMPVTGTGSTGSSILSSSGLPYLGGLPAWSLPRAYVSAPHLQGTQAYMPVVVSPSQGILPMQGWNTYVGSLNPLSSASVLGSNLVYDSRNQADSGSSGQMHLSSMTSPLPQRPDQPECRHFMSTGTCKYGSDCKYHHPKERIAQPAATTMGPHGLPLRPGQPVCPSYTTYGMCKFGQTCRFDHPLPAYPYNYSFSLSSLMDSSLTTFPRMSPAALPSEMPVSFSKFPGLVRNPDGASNKHRNAKISDDRTEQAGSPPPHSSQASSERSHD